MICGEWIESTQDPQSKLDRVSDRPIRPFTLEAIKWMVVQTFKAELDWPWCRPGFSQLWQRSNIRLAYLILAIFPKFIQKTPSNASTHFEPCFSSWPSAKDALSDSVVFWWINNIYDMLSSTCSNYQLPVVKGVLKWSDTQGWKYIYSSTCVRFNVLVFYLSIFIFYYHSATFWRWILCLYLITLITSQVPNCDVHQSQLGQ